MSDKNWKRWTGRGVWAVADQGVFTVANTLLNVLLARLFSPAEYGAFAVAYSVFLLLGALHTALLTEPVLIFGSGKYADCLSGYLRLIVRGHWMLTGAGSLLLATIGIIFWFTGSNLMAQALLGLSLAAPFSLLTWLARRTAYVRLQPHLATVASVIYFLCLSGGLSALYLSEKTSVFAVMAIMGCASAAAGLWLIRRLTAAQPTETELPESSAVILHHWNYGRWAILTTILMWVPFNFYFVALSAWVNLESSASLRAIANLALPLLQANAALGALLLPALVARRANKAEFKRALRFALVLFCAAGLLYALLIGAGGRLLIHHLYGGKYDGQTQILWLLLLIPILDAAAVVISNALRALERPRQIFWAYLGAGLGALTIGMFLSSAWGLIGAASGMVLANIISAVMLSTALYRHLNQNTKEKTRAHQTNAITVSGL